MQALLPALCQAGDVPFGHAVGPPHALRLDWQLVCECLSHSTASLILKRSLSAICCLRCSRVGMSQLDAM